MTKKRLKGDGGTEFSYNVDSKYLIITRGTGESVGSIGLNKTHMFSLMRFILSLAQFKLNKKVLKNKLLKTNKKNRDATCVPAMRQEDEKQPTLPFDGDSKK